MRVIDKAQGRPVVVNKHARDRAAIGPVRRARRTGRSHRRRPHCRRGRQSVD